MRCVLFLFSIWLYVPVSESACVLSPHEHCMRGVCVCVSDVLVKVKIHEPNDSKCT